jgi:hypothetical protein
MSVQSTRISDDLVWPFQLGVFTLPESFGSARDDATGARPTSAAVNVPTYRGGRNIHFCDHPGCTFCGKKSDVKRHRNQHTKTHPFPCREAGCHKTFNHQSGRCRHEQAKHSTAKYYRCDFPGCTKQYKNREGNLWQHQEREHGAWWAILRLPRLPLMLAPEPADAVHSESVLDSQFSAFELIAQIPGQPQQTPVSCC